MSGTYVEPIPAAESLNPVSPGRRLWSRWPARILVLVVALWALAEGASLAIQHTRLRNVLTAQIAAAMGRPVEVRRYGLSFWGGPVIEARSVTVGEDPRFGAEYFLRADSMSVRLGWSSLLRGRIQFDTLSLTRPSLNLVRNAQGDWNIAEWLPHPNAGAAPRAFSGPVLPSMATRFRRIDVDGGRINFKLGDEKLAFAFVGVSGIIETDHPGRWRINLQATPWRAAAVVQQAGTLRVSGDVGGTSSRLRPAAFNVSWTDASLSDVLRLARGDDFGVRGSLALSIEARTDDATGDGWVTSARAELRQLHRWDLAQRPDNPSLNLTARMAWSPSASNVALTQAKIEAPHSILQGDGGVYWGGEPFRIKRLVPPAQAVFSTADIDAGDLMAWVRAFHAGVATNLSLRGLAHVSTVLAGWPPRVTKVAVSSEGIDLSGASLRAPAHLGRVEIRYEPGNLSISPATFSWVVASAPEGSFHIESAGKQRGNLAPALHFWGNTGEVHDLVAMTGAFGWNISRGWDVTGPFACDLRWQSPIGAGFFDSTLHPLGWIEFGSPGKPAGGVALRAPFLNFPIDQIKARVELKPGERQVKLSSAEAFGARWIGTFDRRDPSTPWQFNLSADRLSSTALDRWLNPRWREGFLDRMLPFLNSHSSVAPEDLRASGRIAVDRFTLTPFLISRLEGSLKLEGRHITFSDATGQFYGGQISGSLDVNLQPVPKYRADLNFSRVDVAAFAAAVPGLAGFSAAPSSAQIALDARGATRADLADSLTCQGSARLANARLQDVRAAGANEASSPSAKPMSFSSASADFSCSQRKIVFQNIALASPNVAMEGAGSVDFSRDLDLHLHVTHASPESNYRVGDALRLTGPLATSVLERVEPAGVGRPR